MPTILTPARDMSDRLKKLERAIDRADDDASVTRAEKRALIDHANRLEKRAEGMVAHTGAPVLNTLDRVKELIRGRRFADHVDDAMSTLASGRHKMWREARHDQRTNPFAHLHGYRQEMNGVRSKDFNWEGKRVHVIAVDLANPRLRIETTKPGERGRNIDAMARSHGAEIAINGDFFSYGSYAPSGQAMHRGQKWGGTDWEPSLAFRGRRAEVTGRGAPSWATNQVSGRPSVLRDGRVADSFPEPDKAAPSRRTGVGVSKNGRVLYLVAAEGGMSARDLGRLLKKVGADDGMAMDAGGSAQMWTKERGYVQRSSDPGGTRRVANAILIDRR